LSSEAEQEQLAHIATDGETYGHHHRFGEMALSYALYHIEKEGLAVPSVYGEFLERNPPQSFVEILGNSAWSCTHGVERWRSDCGCHTGGKSGWDQAWRTPLRDALNWFRDTVSPHFEQKAGQYFRDPWAARNDYVRLLLNPSPEVTAEFFCEHGQSSLTEEQQQQALKLLEQQRFSLMMYTSCGWFFNDVSGIETVQILGYASRAVELAEEAFSISVEEPFLNRLALAKSNLPDEKNARLIYEKNVRGSRP
jgi:alpha-amylase/alpha-mannosidase (GH57 family)